ncbi:uncharacterized protein LOC123473718 [Daphnia magna]|uniref:Uncharacterized protein n=2 Tax=Daphnia TaxID=6668 RepID=A0A0P6H8W4_9CRUS|nr:uncharacterized protein LOC123467066 [Daphnia magna]XP_045025416.1 uncharacterized protein LOC123470015 [Daphnia magna]XP_045029475.1 uncharacterized protein LOC123472260 [Daphnia magna]XP_045030919.1 uncharacterized protein LOC123473718 [Daphnia magna]KAI9559428.1 hypothetical protein GHT06_013416 [Daphnia sinensis]KAK4005915.1 hypothetical protein OUZ56_011038 [Daphnia magna]
MSSQEDYSDFEHEPENGEKLDDECCERYAAVIWSSPKFVENDYNCVDIRKISKDMLLNGELHGPIVVKVNINVGCLQAVTTETYIGRVFATGDDKKILKSLLEAEIRRMKTQDKANTEMY